jgi:hypothetical protein
MTRISIINGRTIWDRVKLVGAIAFTCVALNTAKPYINDPIVNKIEKNKIEQLEKKVGDIDEILSNPSKQDINFKLTSLEKLSMSKNEEKYLEETLPQIAYFKAIESMNNYKEKDTNKLNQYIQKISPLIKKENIFKLHKAMYLTEKYDTIHNAMRLELELRCDKYDADTTIKRTELEKMLWQNRKSYNKILTMDEVNRRYSQFVEDIMKKTSDERLFIKEEHDQIINIRKNNPDIYNASEQIVKYLYRSFNDELKNIYSVPKLDLKL